MKNVIWHYRYFAIIFGMILFLQIAGVMWGAAMGINTGLIIRSFFSGGEEDIFYVSGIVIRYEFFTPIIVKIIGHFIFDIFMFILVLAWACCWFIKRHDKDIDIYLLCFLRTSCNIFLKITITVLVTISFFCDIIDFVGFSELLVFIFADVGSLMMIFVIAIVLFGTGQGEFSRLEKLLITHKQDKYNEKL